MAGGFLLVFSLFASCIVFASCSSVAGFGSFACASVRYWSKSFCSFPSFPALQAIVVMFGKTS